MTIEIVNLTPLKVILGFAFGFILGIVLCSPQNINERCIRHNNIIYCEVENKYKEIIRGKYER